MIWYSQPFSTDKNIGRYYNRFMELLPDDGDWACFTDGDTLHLVSDYGKYLEEYIVAYPEVGMWTCMTNRVIQTYQLLHGIIDNNHDILRHRKLATANLQENRLKMEVLADADFLLSGCMIMISKKAWRMAGGFSEGCLGVDNYMHAAVMKTEYKVGLMKGYYLYHFYRGDKHYSNTDHLKMEYSNG